MGTGDAGTQCVVVLYVESVERVFSERHAIKIPIHYLHYSKIREESVENSATQSVIHLSCREPFQSPEPRALHRQYRNDLKTKAK